MRTGTVQGILLTVVLVQTLLAPVVVVGQTGTGTQVRVAASIAPLAGIVKDVGGDSVDVSVLLPEGVEPHAASLPPSSVSAAQEADLLVLTGHFPWEEELLGQVDTPYVTFHDEGSSIAAYETYGASLSPMPGRRGHGTESGNPHGWWMLPANAVAIANATRVALTMLFPSEDSTWDAGLDEFVRDVQTLQRTVQALDATYQFSALHAVAVFPAEAYIAEAFGIHCEAVLQEEGVFIGGSDLMALQEGLSNGSLNVIVGSDIARLQTTGEFAYQLSSDYGVPLVWWKTVFSDIADYVAVMTVNLGALTSALDSTSQGTAVSFTTGIVLVGVVVVLAVVVVIETALIVQRARSDD